MDFQKELSSLINEIKPSWLVRGVLTVDDEIYTFGTDTKILSRVFELLSYPFVKKVADQNGLEVEVPVEQTVYPDFTLYDNKASKKKIAVDVKSTYRRGNRPFGFTLGSYTSFLRSNTKNILYPYDEYSEHWVIGFIYDRDFHSSRSSGLASLKNREEIKPAYKNIEYFIQEKYKISGEKPGSGNTANIGSFLSADINKFKDGVGPFSKLGEKVFREYWSNFGRDNSRPYSNLKEYLEWKKSKVSKD